MGIYRYRRNLDLEALGLRPLPDLQYTPARLRMLLMAIRHPITHARLRSSNHITYSLPYWLPMTRARIFKSLRLPVCVVAIAARALLTSGFSLNDFRWYLTI